MTRDDGGGSGCCMVSFECVRVGGGELDCGLVAVEVPVGKGWDVERGS